MPKPASTLSNCYIPLPLSSSSSSASRPDDHDAAAAAAAPFKQARRKHQRRDAGDGQNKNSRSSHGLRRLVLKSSSSSSATIADTDSATSNANTNTGSTYVELGQTKVLCQVQAPLSSSSSELPSNIQTSMDHGTLVCQVKYVPHIAYPTSLLLANSVSTAVENNSNNSNSQQQQQPQASNNNMSAGKVNSWIVSREADLSVRLHAALAATVPLQQYRKCAIFVRVTILQDDGSILPACITAASLALVDAAVEVYDVVTACSVAVVRVQKDDDEDETIELWADPTLEEETLVNTTLSVMTLATLPNWKHVTIWEQSGSRPLTPALANRAMEICRDGCRTMHLFMRSHLIQQHEQQQQQQQQDGE